MAGPARPSDPVYLAVVWHMHQPYYKDLVTGEYRLPWVRMHGIKDYYDMPAILRDYPEIRQNFNLVPCLLEQILDYAENQAKDRFLDLSLKPADRLSPAERIEILQCFFFAEWENMIKPYPRYWQLLKKRGFDASPERLEKVEKLFKPQDFLDLQVYFNLTWFDPLFKRSDPFLASLLRKGEGFTEEDKGLLLRKQIEVLGKIVPEYRALADAGQIELSTTPYYHPILPLLCNTDRARDACPQIALPRRPFVHPEDARAQVEAAVAMHERLFGRRPRGMWPSEGSVSEEIVPIVADAGIRWMATDEEILACSLERDAGAAPRDKKEFLYRPYRVEAAGRSVDMVFRDHGLSDLIGFVYAKWNPAAAAEDFVGHLLRIRDAAAGSSDPPLVTVILDGENAWEHYPNDGWDFFTELYTRLSREKRIRTTTIGDYLERFAGRGRLSRLHAGSWINHNFRIWIGHEEDNRAWDALSDTRDFLVRAQRERGDALDPRTLERAWKEIYVAEGSDWNWWYGDDHSSSNDAAFDELYRKHLANVYTLLGEEPPDALLLPFRREKRAALTSEITAFLKPTIDGEVTNYYEWIAAALYDVSTVGGTMHQADSIVRRIYYGFDAENLFLRFDPSRRMDPSLLHDLTFQVHFVEPEGLRLVLEFGDGAVRARLLERDNHAAPRAEVRAAWGRIVEAALPFRDLGVAVDDRVGFLILVKRGDVELEKWPLAAYLSFRVPSPEFERIMWSV